MTKLKKIGVLSAAKLQAILMAGVGLIIGTLIASMGRIPRAILGFGSISGLFAIITFPILYAIFGFIGGAIGAFLYNVVAGWVGGLEMDFEQ